MRCLSKECVANRERVKHTGNVPNLRQSLSPASAELALLQDLNIVVDDSRSGFQPFVDADPINVPM